MVDPKSASRDPVDVPPVPDVADDSLQDAGRNRYMDANYIFSMNFNGLNCALTRGSNCCCIRVIARSLPVWHEEMRN